MTERTILWPYSSFDAQRRRALGETLYHLVNENHQILAERGLMSGTSELRYYQLGRTIARMAVHASARQDRIWQAVEERLQTEKQGRAIRPGIGHYAIVAGSPHLDAFDTKQTGIIGTCTMQPFVHRRTDGMSKSDPETYHVVSAWVDRLNDPEESRLSETLRILATIANNRAVILEPGSSSEIFHTAIVAAGFKQQPLSELAAEQLRINPSNIAYVTR